MKVEIYDDEKEFNDPFFKDYKGKWYHYYCCQCHRFASYHYEKELIPRYCRIHKEPLMINIKYINSKKK